MRFSDLNWFDNVENRPHPWPGLNWLTAMLYVNNVKEAMLFYEKVFGIIPIFELTDENNELIFVRMRFRGSNFTLTKAGYFEFDASDPKTTKTSPHFMFYLYVDNVDEIFNKAILNNCKILHEPRLEPWGDYKTRICDPFGYIWELACRIDNKAKKI